MNSQIKKIKISFLASVVIMLFLGCTNHASSSFNSAFVFPIAILNNEVYLIVGREAGGRDRGTYCIPGGSNRGWLGREKDPCKTASRELIEELLLDWSADEAYQKVQAATPTMRRDSIHRKTVISYLITFEKEMVDTVIESYYKRRARHPFWEYAYREMDRISLIKLTDLISAIDTGVSSKNIRVPGIVRNPKTNAEEMAEIRLRPILVHLARKRYLGLSEK